MGVSATMRTEPARVADREVRCYRCGGSLRRRRSFERPGGAELIEWQCRSCGRDGLERVGGRGLIPLRRFGQVFTRPGGEVRG